MSISIKVKPWSNILINIIYAHSLDLDYEIENRKECVFNILYY